MGLLGFNSYMLPLFCKNLILTRSWIITTIQSILLIYSIPEMLGDVNWSCLPFCSSEYYRWKRMGFAMRMWITFAVNSVDIVSEQWKVFRFNMYWFEHRERWRLVKNSLWTQLHWYHKWNDNYCILLPKKSFLFARLN